MFNTRMIWLYCLMSLACAGFSQVEKSDAPNVERSRGYNFPCFDATSIDLDVDTNRDGDINNDDIIEMNQRGLIVEANIITNQGAPIFNQLNNTTSSSEFMNLNELVLKKLGGLNTTDHQVILKVSDNSKIRIFNEDLEGVIGPENSWGGPNASEYILSSSEVTKLAESNLEFLIEGVDHANSIVLTLEVRSLITLDVLGSDQVNLVVGLPFGLSNARNYINAVSNVAFTSTGASAVINTAEPDIWWTDSGPNIAQSASLNWVGLNSTSSAGWIQTGVVKSQVLDNDKIQIYLEIKEPSGAFSMKYVDESLDWTTGEFEVVREGDEVAAFIDGVEWRRQNIMTPSQFPLLNQYQASVEILQSMARAPEGTIDNFKVFNGISWQDITNFEARIVWYKGNNFTNSIDTPVSPTGTYEDFMCEKLSSGIEFEDLRNF